LAVVRLAVEFNWIASGGNWNRTCQLDSAWLWNEKGHLW